MPENLAVLPNALTIAGSDSSGGAGIQADIKTFAALGVFAASVVTAVTAQNSIGVSAVHPIPPDIIATQLDAVLSDLDIDAIKIGMTGGLDAIAAIAQALAEVPDIPVVLDPVMVATTGAALFDHSGLDALRRQLLPRARLITPNLPEAAQLLDCEVASSQKDMRTQARQLLELGAQAVLLKGGHLRGGAMAVDILIDREGAQGEQVFAASWIDTLDTHGSGCSLAAAIAAGLAQGKSLAAAVRQAKQFITRAIAAADRLNVGKGNGPLHHFFN